MGGEEQHQQAVNEEEKRGEGGRQLIMTISSI